MFETSPNSFRTICRCVPVSRVTHDAPVGRLLVEQVSQLPPYFQFPPERAYALRYAALIIACTCCYYLSFFVKQLCTTLCLYLLNAMRTNTLYLKKILLFTICLFYFYYSVLVNYYSCSTSFPNGFALTLKYLFIQLCTTICHVVDRARNLVYIHIISITALRLSFLCLYL